MTDAPAAVEPAKTCATAGGEAEAKASWSGSLADLLRLGDSALEAVAVCMQPELFAEAGTLRFAEVALAEQFTDEHWRSRGWPNGASAVLMLAQRSGDMSRLLTCCAAIGANESSPTTIAVLLPSFGHGGEPTPGSMLELHEAILDRGIDDVIHLLDGERLSAQRLSTAILRTEKTARHFQKVAEQKVSDVEARARRALHVATRRFLWEMPGKTLANIPALDTSLKAWTAAPGRTAEPGQESVIGGIGDYTFTALLGKGSFGAVFKAKHPKLGCVAVKTMDKSMVKNAHGLFSLDRECCIMLHLPPHEHVVRAHCVLHAQDHLYIVMDFAGQCSLHQFIMQSVEAQGKNSGTGALDPKIATSFCDQEALGLAHMHRAKVCHRDLKPANFIVSDEGRRLRLTDFGFSLLVCGPGQKLADACGSLPFCAPEVLSMGLQGAVAAGKGYDGFAADVWSLGVNFLEMVCGPYSVEKLMNWVPSAPASLQQKIKDVETLAQCKQLKSSSPDQVLSIIAHMLAVKAEARWTMAQVLGPQGLNREELSTQQADEMPEFLESNPQRLRTMTCVANKGVLSRSLGPAVLQQVASIDRAAPLAEQLGGTAVIRLALDKLFDHMLSDPLVKPLFQSYMPFTSSVCSRMKKGLTLFLYPVLDEKWRDDTHSKLRSVHHGLNITDAHFDVFLEHIRRVFQDVGVRADAVQDAVVKIATARSDIRSGHLVRSSLARCRNTAAWKAEVLAGAQERIAEFARCLEGLIASEGGLAGSPPSQWTMQDLDAHLTSHLRGEAAACIPDAGLQLPDAEFGLLVNDVRVALEETTWPLEVVETLHLMLIEERNRVRLLTSLVGLRGCLTEDAWETAQEQLGHFMISLPRLQYFGEHPNLPRCLARLGEILISGTCEDLDRIADAHRELGLDNEHYDLFLRFFSTFFSSTYGEEGGAQQQVIECVRGLRPWVLRHSAARQAQALLERGGKAAQLPTASYSSGAEADAACRRRLSVGTIAHSEQASGCCFENLYRFVEQDQRINGFFAGAKLDNVKSSQSIFINQIMNGNSSETFERGLALRHQKWAISDYHFDSFMEAVRKACPRNLDQDYRLGRLEVLRPRIVTTQQGSKEDPTAARSGVKTGGRGSAEGDKETDLNWIIDDALHRVGLSALFSDFSKHGVFAPPCKMLGLLHFLRQAVRGTHKAQDLDGVQGAHAHLALSERQFSVLESAFRDSCREACPGSAQARRIMEAIGSLKAVLTVDEDDRRKAAQEQLQEPGGRQWLLEQFGGAAGLRRVVERWLQLLAEEPSLQCFYSPVSGISGAARCLKLEHLVSLVEKSPEHASVTCTGRTLAEVHRRLNLGPELFQPFVRCLRRAMHQMSVPQQAADMYAELVEAQRPSILSGS